MKEPLPESQVVAAWTNSDGLRLELRTHPSVGYHSLMFFADGELFTGSAVTARSEAHAIKYLENAFIHDSNNPMERIL